jgi:peptide/nickel transport system permease protein
MRRSAAALVGAGWLALLALGCAVPQLVAHDPLTIDLERAFQAPSAHAWMGTDELGRDVFSRIVYGARSTLFIASIATLIALGIGCVGGIAGGYRGGALDAAVGILIDLFWAVPYVIFVILIVAAVGFSPLSLAVTIGLVNWVTVARAVRPAAAMIRHQPYVRTARALGLPRRTLITTVLLPNVRSVITAVAAYCAIEVMTLETGLSFLGLGVAPPLPTWGGMLAEGLAYYSSAAWVSLGVAAVITTTLAALQAIGAYFERVR